MDPDAKSNNRYLRLIMTLTCGCLAALCVSLGVRSFGHPPGLRVNALSDLLGTQVPRFEISGLENGKVSPEMIGEVPYILYFAASDCQACESTYPSLRRVASRIPVFIVGIGARATLRKLITANDIPAVVGYDSTRAVSRKFRIRSVPSALFVDDGGIIRQAATGPAAIERMFSSFSADGKGD